MDTLVSRRRRCCAALHVVLLSIFSAACTTTFEGSDPLEKQFPSVQAQSLAGERVVVPEFFAGGDTLLLIGFVQNAQFDIDRWILGLKQLETPVGIAELPTIQGAVPRMISKKINQGMKDGIPQADWKIVFTVYEDAEKIAEFLGNQKPLNARVVLVDEHGRVHWFHDRGYSADRLLELDALIRGRKP